jgi:DNA-binding MarR family transcriptional regulator
VALTRKGRNLIDRAFTDHIANEHRLLADLTRSQAASLEAVLTAWLRRFE